MTIQEVCKAKRNALGMTIQDIAEASGIPPSTVNNSLPMLPRPPISPRLGQYAPSLACRWMNFTASEII